MKIVNLLIGVVIGLAAAFAGTYIFLEMFTDYGFESGIHIMREKGLLGKVITIGAILNLIAFFILLQLKKDMMARGVILGTIILALITVIV